MGFAWQAPRGTDGKIIKSAGLHWRRTVPFMWQSDDFRYIEQHCRNVMWSSSK